MDRETEAREVKVLIQGKSSENPIPAFNHCLVGLLLVGHVSSELLIIVGQSSPARLPPGGITMGTLPDSQGSESGGMSLLRPGPQKWWQEVIQ